MEWLSFEWIALNWMPLLVAVVVGFLLGWLFTGAPAGRRAAQAEAGLLDLDARARKAERELADARRDLEARQTRLASATTELDAALARAAELETSLAALRDEKAALATRLDDMAQAAAAAAAAAAPAESALATRAEVDAEFAAVARAPEAVSAPSPKDIALDEAFGRAAALQHELEERDTILAMRQAELETLKSELLTSNAARRELEARLVRAREDVASELAVLASTMIKMKDDALTRSEARLAVLQSEVDALRLAAERATQTAD